VELSCCAMPVRLLENLGAQPTLLPLFPGASKIADRLAGLHSLLRVGQPHGDPHALNTLMKDVGLARGEYSGAGLPGRRAAGTRCGVRGMRGACRSRCSPGSGSIFLPAAIHGRPLGNSRISDNYQDR
jgi:hypothetical protein